MTESWPTGAWAGSDAASTLVTHLNQMVDNLDGLNGRAPLAWTSYTPTLTAVTTNPTLGTGGFAHGYYVQIGKTVIDMAWIRFGTASRNSGSGIYGVDLPIDAKGRGYTAGMTSDLVGFGAIYRAGGALDLGYGAHIPVMCHTFNGDNSKTLMTFPAGATGGNVQRAYKTADQTGISATAPVTGLSVTMPVYRDGAIVEITGKLTVGLNTAANNTVYVDILKDGSLFERAAATPSEVLSGFYGIATVPLYTIDDSPSVASHVYTVQVTPEANTVDVKCSSTQRGILVAKTLPAEPAAVDYAADNNPWNWSAQTSQAEIWNLRIYEGV